mmetsp:Transcript_58811/g.174985  ORF Transcript_58811/g.174985 Transcript_58811/m.174985 type:complete len:291 (-) Transcript_58811:536-1408(-)
MRAFGGGSSASEKQAGWRPELRTWSMSSMREHRRISGVGISWSRRSKRLRVTRWKLKPSRTRPARPRRCRTSAREMNCSFREEVLEGSWYRWLLTLPLSTTKTTSGMVTPVSAMFVLSTILRTPRRGRSKAFACSSPLRTLWSESTRHFAGSPKVGERESLSCTLVISMMPGRKTSTAPSSRGTAANCGELSMSSSVASMRSRLMRAWSSFASVLCVDSWYLAGSQHSASSSQAQSSSSSTYAVSFSILPFCPDTWKVSRRAHPEFQPRFAKSLSSSHWYPDISMMSSIQ